MIDLERSHTELRAALILAGKEIRKLNFRQAEYARAADAPARTQGCGDRGAKGSEVESGSVRA